MSYQKSDVWCRAGHPRQASLRPRTFNYDENGNIVQSIDALGNVSTFEYDGFDRTVKVTDAAGHYRTTEYDGN